jgi:hypothetical protein
MTFDEIVDDYIFRWRVAARAEMRSFAREDSLTAAIRRAALCKRPNGKRHEHQCSIPHEVLEEAERRLQAATSRLARAVSPRTVYDVAHRIGAYLGPCPCLSSLWNQGRSSGARIQG